MTGVIKFVTSANASDVVQQILDAKVAGIDTETTSLHPKNGKVRLIQLSIPGTNFILDCFREDPRLLAPIFNGSVVLVGHNIAFDLRFAWSVGLTVPHGRNLFDTMVAGQLLDAGIFPQKSHSLQAMAAEYMRLDISKEQRLTDWSGTLTKDQLIYAAQDAAVLLPLHQILTKKLHEAQLERVMRLEMRCLPGMVWLTMSGMPIDPDAWTQLAMKYKEEVDKLEYALADLTNTHDLFGWSQVNWRSPDQVLQMFRRRGVRIEDTKDETLSALASRGDELAEMLLTYREKVKRRDTYGMTWLEKHVSPDNRVYADYRQLEAVTGRMSCANPNLQNIPRDPVYRACFRPVDGRSFTIGDYSQIELRICVEITQDPAGMQAYCVDKTDLHMTTAQLILGSTTKEARQVAKSLNFGLIFGSGAETLQAYALKTFGVNLSLEEATKLRNEWRRTYAGIVRWQRSIKEGVEAVRTLSGRRRLGVDSYTMKLNTPVQGTGVDGLKAAIALAYERRNQIPSSAMLVGVIHDEMVFECDDKDAEELAYWQQKQMEEGMQSFLKVVPVEAEAKVAATWGDK
jgi:DNA polymerase-1